MFDPKKIGSFKGVMNDIQKDIKKLDWYCITDPGSTTCFAVLFAAINPYTKQVYLLDELYETSQENTTVRQIYPRIKAKMKELNPHIEIDDWYKVYDEAAAWFATELMGQFGIIFYAYSKTSIQKGARTIFM